MDRAKISEEVQRFGRIIAVTYCSYGTCGYDTWYCQCTYHRLNLVSKVPSIGESCNQIIFNISKRFNEYNF